MSWDPAWEQIFRVQDWGRYPPEELVAIISRSFGQVVDRGAVKLLEIGCGPGANVWFMSREGYSVCGVDGSQTAIAKAKARLASEGLDADLRVGDMAELPFQEKMFDAVVDIGSIQHNLWVDQKRIVEEAWRVLAPGGMCFAMMLGIGSWGEGEGDQVETGTYKNICDGPARGCGITHFYSEADLRGLFETYGELKYDRKERTLFNGKKKLVHWLVTAVK